MRASKNYYLIVWNGYGIELLNCSVETKSKDIIIAHMPKGDWYDFFFNYCKRKNIDFMSMIYDDAKHVIYEYEHERYGNI